MSLCFLLCFAAACLLEMEHSGSLNEMCFVDVTLHGCWEAILPKNCWHLYWGVIPPHHTQLPHVQSCGFLYICEIVHHYYNKFYNFCLPRRKSHPIIFQNSHCLPCPLSWSSDWPKTSVLANVGFYFLSSFPDHADVPCAKYCTVLYLIGTWCDPKL